VVRTAAQKDFLLPKSGPAKRRGDDMLRYALIFLVIAIIAGIFGFGGISVASAGIAKILFGIFIVLFLIGLIMHLSRGGTAV
jgi:uncharacterized membrane protein YtjA (UPF0391 family)